MVAICALQNFAMCSRIINRAIAEVGGILVVQEPLLSLNSDVATQASLLIKFFIPITCFKNMCQMSSSDY